MENFDFDYFLILNCYDICIIGLFNILFVNRYILKVSFMYYKLVLSIIFFYEMNFNFLVIF